MPLNYADLERFAERYGITRSDVARLLGVKLQHLNGWEKHGSLPAWRASQLQAYLDLEEVLKSFSRILVLHPAAMLAILNEISPMTAASIPDKVSTLLALHQCPCEVCKLALRERLTALLHEIHHPKYGGNRE